MNDQGKSSELSENPGEKSGSLTNLTNPVADNPMAIICHENITTCRIVLRVIGKGKIF